MSYVLARAQQQMTRAAIEDREQVESNAGGRLKKLQERQSQEQTNLNEAQDVVEGVQTDLSETQSKIDGGDKFSNSFLRRNHKAEKLSYELDASQAEVGESMQMKDILREDQQQTFEQVAQANDRVQKAFDNLDEALSAYRNMLAAEGGQS